VTVLDSLTHGGGTIDGHRRERSRQVPASAVSPEGSTSTPFKLVSTLSERAVADEVEQAWGGRDLPSDAVDPWAACREARLFEDVDYGQWGLALLAPSASAARTAQEREARPSEFGPDDIVLGEFLGDQELLVLAPSEKGGGGGVSSSRRMAVSVWTAWWRWSASCQRSMLQVTPCSILTGQHRAYGESIGSGDQVLPDPNEVPGQVHPHPGDPSARCGSRAFGCCHGVPSLPSRLAR
jgi:hypothetical protein